jgi:F-type H+-transporting ATPase subunit alpha
MAREREQEKSQELSEVIQGTVSAIQDVLEGMEFEPESQEIGVIRSIGDGIAWVSGLPGVQSEELIRFPYGVLGIAFNLEEEEVASVLLGPSEELQAGQEVHRTGRVLDVPVGEGLLGRIIDPLGRPLDTLGPVHSSERNSIQREAPAIMDRDPVNTPLQTGIQVIDALIPIGRGQRELILGDRQTGKTAIAVDTIINQKNSDVISVYCAIGERSTAVVKVVGDLKSHGVMDDCIVVVSTGEDTPGLKYIAPYSATAIAEYFMQRGRDVLIVYDDMTRHARAYRELSLLLRRPPAREAYPGDIFYIHSRLLERSTHLRKEHGGGSLTALPIIETQAQNISAYIPTNLVSITDGQIYLSPRLFAEGLLPAIDVGTSVSRVGGKTQLNAYRAVAGDLRLSYSQFEELEAFSRFGTRLEEDTQQQLERGRRVREILKQPQYTPMSVPEQIAVLISVTEGLFDPVPLADISKVKEPIRRETTKSLPDLSRRILEGKPLEERDRKAILDVAQRVIDTTLGLKRDEDTRRDQEEDKGDGRSEVRGTDDEGPGSGEHP